MGRQNVSFETTMARAAAAGAERRWRGHKLNCPRCAAAQRSRRPGYMCDSGTGLYDAMKARKEQLAAGREPGKQPIPGQGELFVIEDVPVATYGGRRVL